MEYSFEPCKVTASNMNALIKEHALLSERRICELYELAVAASDFSSSLIGDGFGIYEALSLIAEGYPAISDTAKSDLINRFNKNIFSLELFDKTVFSALYVEAIKKCGIDLTEEELFDIEEKPDQTFVYVKNTFADEAYDVFSQEFSDPRVRYAKNFREALKMVSDGEVTYCLLPLEERGIRLSSISELILQGDCKINSVTPVFGFDGAADIKYALVSKHFCVPPLNKDDDRYFEIRIPSDASPSVSDVLYACERYGVTVYRVDTLPFTKDGERKKYFSIVLSGEGVDFSALIVFLTLFVPDYTAVGMYKNLEF
ncbi:MAG: hypothetical protein IJX92_05875 [Clostridia bacterium]|nr:hypothetical protein [Clostridia bacterium]